MVRQNVMLSAGSTRVDTGTFWETAALKMRAPSMCILSPRAWALSANAFVFSAERQRPPAAFWVFSMQASVVGG